MLFLLLYDIIITIMPTPPETAAAQFKLTESDPAAVVRLMQTEKRQLVRTGFETTTGEQALPVHIIPGKKGDGICIQMGGFGWTPGGEEPDQDSAFRAGLMQALREKSGKLPTMVSIGFPGVEQARLLSHYPDGQADELTPIQLEQLQKKDFTAIGQASANALLSLIKSGRLPNDEAITLLAPSLSSSIGASMLRPLLESGVPLNGVALLDPVAVQEKKFGELVKGLTLSATRHPLYLAQNGETYQEYSKHTVATSKAEWFKAIFGGFTTNLAYAKALGGDGITTTFAANSYRLAGDLRDAGVSLDLAFAGGSEYDTLRGAERLLKSLNILRCFGSNTLRLTGRVYPGASHAMTSTQKLFVDAWSILQEPHEK